MLILLTAIVCLFSEDGISSIFGDVRAIARGVVFIAVLVTGKANGLVVGVRAY